MPRKRSKKTAAKRAANSLPAMPIEHTDTTTTGSTGTSKNCKTKTPSPLERPKTETATGESGELFRTDASVVNTTTTISTTTMTTGLMEQPQPKKDETTTTTAMDDEVPKISDNDEGIVYVAVDGYMSQIMEIKVKKGDSIYAIKEEIKQKGSPAFDSIAAFKMKVYQSIEQTAKRKSNDENAEQPLTPALDPMDATTQWDSKVTWGTKKQPLIVRTPQPPINTSAPFEYAPSKTLLYLLKDRRGVIPELARDNQSLQSTAHTSDTGHVDATIRTNNTNTILHIAKFLSYGKFSTNYSVSEVSLLLTELGNRQKLVYQNETEVQDYVKGALKDALAALGLSNVLMVRPEISLFSYRPDIIVVTHSSFGIVLIVEVKKPGKDVFTSRCVGGQVYDYLVGMLGMGISCPFAVLTTYEEMVIAHLGDGEEVLEKVVGNMGNNLVEEIKFLNDGTKPMEDEGQGQVKPPGSPLSQLNLVVSNAPASDNNNNNDHNSEATVVIVDAGTDEGAANESDDSNCDRVVYYSDVVERKDVLKSLMLAIRCGIEAGMQSTPRSLPTQGSKPSFACARVNEDGMVWCNLPAGLKIDYFSFPTMRTESFYLLHNLGKGSHGRAFLVCNSGGKTLVAKFFLIKDVEAHRQQISDQERQTERTKLLLGRKAEAEKEMQYWESVYNKKYDVQVRKLHGHWCLMLPYFDPILDVDSRRRYLPEVRKILDHFKSEKLMYNEDDLRWRHVGIRQGQICLFDLGSLQPCEEEASIDVDKQIQILEANIESS